MATTYTDNGGGAPNGSDKIFTYSFETIESTDTTSKTNSEVKVALNGVTQATTKYDVIASPASIEFNNTSIDTVVQESTGAPKTGVTVRVYRDTQVTSPANRRHVFQAGSAIKANALNDIYEHTLFALDEEREQPVYSEDIEDGAVTTAKIQDDSIVNAHIKTDAAIAHSKLATIDSGKILLGNVSNIPTATALTGDVHIDNAGATTIQDNAVQIANISDTETSLTSTSDVKLPTSKAVADHVADVVNSVGGFRVVANKDSFPDAHPDPKENAGTVLSITNPLDLTVTAGTSTNGTRSGGGSVTITDIPTDAGSTLSANYSMLVQTTTTAHTYTFYKFLAKDGDVLSLSNDMNDFAARYRVTAGEPSDSLDEGDLCFDTDASKMKVYNGSTWGEVTATGDYKFLTLANTGTSNAATFNGTSDDTFDLKVGISPTGTAATVTTALQCIVSLNGVIQKPNTGTFDGTQEGFYIPTSSTIKFCDPPPANSQVFVVQIGTGTQLQVPNDNSVTAAKTDLSIAQGDVIVGTGVDAWTNLSAGTSGQYLKTQGTGADVVWADVPAGVGGATGVSFDDGVEAIWGADSDLTIKEDSNQAFITAKASGKIHFGNGSSNNQVSIGHHGTGNAVLFSNGNTEIGNHGWLMLNSPQCVLKFQDSANLKTVGFKAASTIAADVTWELPATDATSSGQALTSDAAGTLSWSNVSSTVADSCIYENDQTISNAYTIAAGKGAHSVGPLTINATVTVNGRWVIS
tara:strand:+ start:1740 stop:3986 length:2247 start_codon:yes stop_codon:yes gene_type:complete